MLILKLEPDKTKVTTFKQGFDFPGFTVSTNGVSMRTDSPEKLKDKVRKLTTLFHNFSGEVIENLNQVIRRIANCFAADFSAVNAQFLKLDEQTRRRLRCMKKKRILVKDNLRIPNRFFQKKGLVSFCSFVSKN